MLTMSGEREEVRGRKSIEIDSSREPLKYLYYAIIIVIVVSVLLARL